MMSGEFSLARFARLAWWGLFVLALAWTAWSGLVPVKSLPSLPLWDKAAHALNYALLTLLLLSAMRRPRPWLAALWMMACGIVVELAQWHGGYRTGDWLDALANLAGIMAVALPASLLLRRRSAVG